MFFESEPLEAQPLGQAPPPGQLQRWTPLFLIFLALIAVIGAAATLYGIAGNPIAGASGSLLNYNAARELAALALNLVLFVACLVGLILARSALLRAGLLLQAIVSLWSMFLDWPSVILAFHLNNQNAPWMASLYLSLFFLYGEPVMPLIELVAGLLSVLILVSFSYVLARWQSSDKVFIWVQVVVTLGLGFVLLETFPSLEGLPWAEALWIKISPFLEIAACVSVLLRPACWKANPLIVLCFTLGTVVSFLYAEAVDHFFHVSGPQFLVLQVDYAISLASLTLFILGVLLLIQRVRLQQQAQHNRPRE